MLSFFGQAHSVAHKGQGVSTPLFVVIKTPWKEYETQQTKGVGSSCFRFVFSYWKQRVAAKESPHEACILPVIDDAVCFQCRTCEEIILCCFPQGHVFPGYEFASVFIEFFFSLL